MIEKFLKYLLIKTKRLKDLGIPKAYVKVETLMSILLAYSTEKFESNFSDFLSL